MVNLCLKTYVSEVSFVQIIMKKYLILKKEITIFHIYILIKVFLFHETTLQKNK